MKRMKMANIIGWFGGGGIAGGAAAFMAKRRRDTARDAGSERHSQSADKTALRWIRRRHPLTRKKMRRSKCIVTRPRRICGDKETATRRRFLAKYPQSRYRAEVLQLGG